MYSSVDWDNVSTICAYQSYFKRLIVETLEIQKEEVCNPDKLIINERAGQYVPTDTWKPLRKIRNIQCVRKKTEPSDYILF